MKYGIFLTILFSSIVGMAQDRVLVDGLFSEWGDYPVLYSDALGDGGGSGIDFGALHISNDAEFLYFSLEIGSEINLQDLNDISIYLDTDDAVSTGKSINGIGADLEYTFGDRRGVFYRAGNTFSIFHDDIGLISAPTVTSDRFEIAIRRDISIFGTQIFQGNSIKVLFKDDSFNGDELPSANGGIAYSFATNNPAPLPDFSIQKPQASSLRIVSYNVLSDGFFDQARLPAFRRIFQATQPDIIGLQEIYDYSSAEVANQMESILPSTAGQAWYHAKQGPDCHVVSRYPILESAFIPGYNQSAGNGAFLIDMPGMEKDMLMIVAHPPCCSNNAGRQIEVDLIMQFLRNAKAGIGPIALEAGAPIIILGDMNFVGFSRQLETLLTGDIVDEATYGADFKPDWDGTDLLDSHPYSTGMPFSFTWYDEGSSFSPGRLDYILYSGSNLVLENSYALFTPNLPQDSLTTYYLGLNDVLDASDHLPLVADFKFKTLTPQKEVSLNRTIGIQTIYPNPSNDWTEISFTTHEQDFVVLQLMNQAGEAIAMLHQKNMPAGNHTVQVNTSNIPSGMYYVYLKTFVFMDSKRLVVLR